MLEQFKKFAEDNGLEFSYTIDETYDAHRLAFTNPKTGKRFSYMIHTPELQIRKRTDLEGFIDFMFDNARKLI